MSEPTSGAASAAPLQFDTVEPDTASASASATPCTACQTPIADAYYQANAQVICPHCRDGLQAQLSGQPSAGNYVVALLLGAGAAVLGTVLFVGLAILLKSVWGFVAIAVGWLVGKAVRKGSGDRGGTPFQAMAMVLTYLSILGAYALFASLGDETPGLLALLLSPIGDSSKNPVQWLIGAVIVGIALFEAWKLTGRVEIQLSGPYRIAPAQPEGERAVV